MKRILVGLDGSPRAPAVLDAAVKLAKSQGARVVLMRGVGLPPDVPQDFWRTTDEPLLEVLKRNAKEYLEGCVSKVPKDCFGGIEIAVGVPWQAVCEMARAVEADVVVIGSHGYSGFDRLLGTTAAKVVNHAPCTVVVVREPPQKKQES
ncbi:MAG TPA: universal stress protein [Polyangiaceae bacterium]|nr:universal stress protein [Polyangiaceae bacterium]